MSPTNFSSFIAFAKPGFHGPNSSASRNHIIHAPQLITGLCPNKLIVSWKYLNSNMHWICLTYGTSWLNNTAHWRVLVVPFHDPVAKWELHTHLAAPGWHCNKVLDCISPAQEEINTQNSKYGFYWSILFHTIVKTKNHKLSHSKLETIYKRMPRTSTKILQLKAIDPNSLCP